MDGLFTKVYSTPAARPIVPHEFLYSVWSYSHDLAGYEQQDAHEFLIALLNGIHMHSKGGPGGGSGGQDCPCIVHQVFGGTLRSDVTCLTCNYVSTGAQAIS